MIRKGEVHELKALMKKSSEVGMQTFDQSLYALYKEDQITYEDALAHADSANDLRLLIKLGDNKAVNEDDVNFGSGASGSLSVEEDDEPEGMRIKRR